MFRVQTVKERIDQAYREKVVVFPPRSGARPGPGPKSRSGSRAQGSGGVFSASPGLKGSSNAAREARLSRFSEAHLPKNRGPGGGASRASGRRGSKQRGPGGGASRTSRRGSKQRGSGGGANRSSSKRRK